MVDIGMTTHATRASGGSTVNARSGSGTAVLVRQADEAALDDYQRFCDGAVHSPAQHPIWIRSWLDSASRDGIFVFVEREGRTVVALALEVVRQGPFRIARFMGGNHANGNFVATDEGSAPLGEAERRLIRNAIRKGRPDIDIVVLERQNPTHGGLVNPLAPLKTIQSPNVSLAMSLDGGFSEALARVGGKRRRKKYRLQLRKFEEAGGHRLIEATTPDEVERLISDFFVMKAARFRKKGIHDVFAAQDVQRFFRQLYLRALAEREPPFVLHAVEVAGELRAVNGLSLQDHGVVCEFGGIRDDDTNASPGYFLDYSNIEQACDLGKTLYDFSVGDEEYKRSWCDIETWQFDILLPLTVKGRLAYVWGVGRARIVGFVKSNELLWSAVKGLRKGSSDAKPVADDD
jgi:CelD/BcsL family acetyltransferase involved in cellulose biosynthesis